MRWPDASLSASGYFSCRRLRGSTAHLVTELDQASLPQEAAPRVPPITRDRATPDVAVATGDSNAFVDLMVLYTPAARAAIGGTSSMVAELTGALNNANLALANAGVTHRFRLVHQSEVAYTETGTWASRSRTSRLPATGSSRTFRHCATSTTRTSSPCCSTDPTRAASAG